MASDQLLRAISIIGAVAFGATAALASPLDHSVRACTKEATSMEEIVTALGPRSFRQLTAADETVYFDFKVSPTLFDLAAADAQDGLIAEEIETLQGLFAAEQGLAQRKASMWANRAAHAPLLINDQGTVAVQILKGFSATDGGTGPACYIAISEDPAFTAIWRGMQPAVQNKWLEQRHNTKAMQLGGIVDATVRNPEPYHSVYGAPLKALRALTVIPEVVKPAS